MKLLFFDPDAGQENIAQMTTAFREFLLSVDRELVFQPVHNFETLSKLIKQPDAGFVIVSSAALEGPVASAVIPILVPSRGGNAHYTKVLLQKAGTAPGDLKGKSIAVTTYGTAQQDLHQHLLDQLGDTAGVQVGSASVIPVSKDIDGLLALVFGQVQAALVTQASLDALDSTIPGSRKSLLQVYESREILRSPLAVIPKNVSPRLRDKMQAAFLAMDKSEAGKTVLSMLRCDSWRAMPKGQLP